ARRHRDPRDARGTWHRHHRSLSRPFRFRLAQLPRISSADAAFPLPPLERHSPVPRGPSHGLGEAEGFGAESRALSHAAGRYPADPDAARLALTLFFYLALVGRAVPDLIGDHPTDPRPRLR